MYYISTVDDSDTHLSGLDVPDVDSLILVQRNCRTFRQDVHLHWGNVLLGTSDHPAITRFALLSLEEQDKTS